MMFKPFNFKSLVYQIRNNDLLLVVVVQNPSLFRFISQISEPYQIPQSETTNAVDFLMSSCGLSSKKAESAAKKIRPNFKTQNPNYVLEFLKSTSFSKTHIAKLISTCPALLFSSVEKTLKPKHDLFKESGFSDAQIADFMVVKPSVFFRSLESQIVPALESIRSFVQTDENVIRVVRRSVFMLTNNMSARLEPNLRSLRECNVPESRIAYVMMTQPSMLLLKENVLKEAIDKVMELGFQPETKMFTVALHAMSSMKKTTWDCKVKLLKEWGWSDEQIIDGFKRVPLFMSCSEKKMNVGLSYFSKTLKWDASILSINPKCLMFSLKTRVMPRVKVFKILVAKKVFKTESELIKILNMSEEYFLNKVVVKHKDYLPEFYKPRKVKI